MTSSTEAAPVPPSPTAGSRSTPAAPSADPRRERAARAIEAELSELVSRIRLYLRRTAESVSPGLTPANYKVLSIIARRGPITLSRLTEHFGVDKSLLSRAVRELESLEFIARTPDPEDRRSQLLTATAFGLERLDAARRSEENRLVGALSGWDVTDVERLAALLHALNSGDAPEVPER